jgi:hypothetical protein
MQSTNTVAIEVEDIVARADGAEIDRRHGSIRVIQHANERVVETVVRMLRGVLKNRCGSVGI